MNSAELLYNRYRVTANLDSSGKVFFAGVGRCLSSVTGDEAAYKEIRQLMIDVEENAKNYLQKDDRIIVTGERQIIVLYPAEVRGLLKGDPDLYMRALKRGKSELRYQVNERRELSLHDER